MALPVVKGAAATTSTHLLQVKKLLKPELPHGASRYKNRGCHCEVCREGVKLERRRDREKARRLLAEKRETYKEST